MIDAPTHSTPDRRRSAERTALRPTALFDGTTPRLVERPTVILDRGRVLAVETGRIELADDIDIVDLDGCTLLPGLVDPHVHLCFDASPDPIGNLAGRDPVEVVRAATEAAAQQLRAGVTTVRDLGDSGFLSFDLPRGDDPELPTILRAGPPITTPGGHCHFLGGEAAGIAALRSAVDERAERGAEVIKVMASGGFLTPGSEPDAPQYTPEELRAIVATAHGHGLPVVAHAHSLASVRAAVDAGVDGIEHCSFLTADGVVVPDDLVDEIARRRIVVGATIGVLPGSELPPFLVDILPSIHAAHARLHAAGAPVVAATDAGIAPIKPHGVLAHAGSQLLEMGFSPQEALRSMTVEAARVCGVGNRKGRIASGYDADLLAVTGNPFTDLSVLGRPVSVFRAGRPVELTQEVCP